MTILVTLVVNITIVLLLFFILSRRISRRTRPEAILDEIHEEIGNIITELNQTTDRNIGLIEDRVQKLQSLLQDADKRIGVMRREVDRRTESAATYSDIVKRSSARRLFTGIAEQESEEQTQRGNRQADQQGNQQEPREGYRHHHHASRQQGSDRDRARPGPSSSRPEPGESHGTADEPATDDISSRSNEGGYQARRRQIVELHRKGIAPNLIATRVGSTIGEVELVISLEDRKR